MDGRSEETERAGAAGDPAAQREQRLQRLINRLPSRLRSTAMWLRQPSRRWLRTCVGVLLIAGSLLRRPARVRGLDVAFRRGTTG